MAEVMSSTMNVKKHGNEDTGSPCKENKWPSHLKSHSTPNKADSPQGFNGANCINKNTNSPQKNACLFNQKNLLRSPLLKSPLLKNPLLKSPVFKRWNKSVDTTQVDACPQRRRTISTNSDYNTFKLELCNNTENLNSFEDIDLLHDLDSIVKFEDSKDILLSTMMDVNSIQDDLEVNKDPVTDPLSISDCEKKDPDTFANSDSKGNRKRRIESKSQVKRQSKRLLNFKKQKCKLNTEEEHILKESENFNEWEETPLSDIKKLMELHIKLTHKVPPQHKIELSGSHAPTRKQKILFQKHGPIRKGSYKPIEDKIIRKNWKMFCKLHNWDKKKVEPFLYWRHNGRYYIQDVKERQKFVQFLANELPWRTLYSVYSRFKILYCNKITYARYTPKEDEKILMYIQSKHLDKRDRKYIELAKILKRTHRSIFKRYRYLKNQIQDKSETEPLVDVKWTLLLIKKFIKTLLNVTLSEDIIELKDATLPKPVWQKMEEKLNIHQNVLRTFWHHQLHLQLFSISPIYLNDIKIQLIEYMYAKGISNTREIIWPNVAKYFDGATAVFLCKVFFYLVQECNMSDVDNFADVVEHLYHTKIPEIQKVKIDKFLPKILYKNEKVSLLNENSKTATTDIDQGTEHTDSTDSCLQNYFYNK